MNRVLNKVIIITSGGATEIGKAVCPLLAREGASIASEESKFVTARELIIDDDISRRQLFD